MRVQKVDERTLRIFLSFSELAERNISMADLFQRSSQTEQYFCDMIEKAGEEVEFALDSPFWIQAQIVSGDEFVITVLKQEDQDELETEPKPKPKRRMRSNQWIYRFEDWEQVVAVAGSLQKNISTKNSLYFMNNAYYLLINSRGITGIRRQRVESILKEYGERMNLSQVFLQEYGKLIQEDNAISTVQQFFTLDQRD